MGVVTAASYAAAHAAQLNQPIVAWQTIVTIGNVSAGTEEDAFPATHLANPRTDLRWQATDTSAVTITIDIGEATPVDYVAVARHNWGTAGISVSVDVAIPLPAISDHPGTPVALIGGARTLSVTATETGDPEYGTAVAAFEVDGDGPLLIRFARAEAASAIRINLSAGSAIPRAAVLYAGTMMLLPRRLYVGHAPAPLARVIEATEGRSQTGDFLGSVILAEHVATSVAMQNIDPAWLRANLKDFFAQRAPFFFAWRPDSYPDELAFAWFPAGHNPTLSNARPNGMMDASFQMQGFVD